jgi:fido (protein-threonine AMPylation protein)
MDANASTKSHLEWKPHELPNYDQALTTACATEFHRLRTAGSAERLKFITDPREVHERLYASLTPPTHPEYAGTYRGTVGTSLEHRHIAAPLETKPGVQQFANPDRVAHWMEQLEAQGQKIFDLPQATPSLTVLSEIVRLFYLFGMTHPFLDGNGHIQRLIFAACVIERNELQLHDTWTIHPRPYDIEIKLAFESPTFDERIAKLRTVLKDYVSTHFCSRKSH